MRLALQKFKIARKSEKNFILEKVKAVSQGRVFFENRRNFWAERRVILQEAAKPFLSLIIFLGNDRTIHFRIIDRYLYDNSCMEVFVLFENLKIYMFRIAAATFALDMKMF